MKKLIESDSGYTVLRDVVPRHLVDACYSLFSKHIKRELGPHDGRDGHATRVRADDLLLHEASASELSDQEVSFLRGQMPLVVRLSEEVMSVAHALHASGTLSKVGLDPKSARLHLPPMGRFILPGSQVSGVPPHADDDYNQHLSQFLVTWIPLVPVDAQCGGVRMFDAPTPGKHDSASEGTRDRVGTSGSVRTWHPARDTRDLVSVDVVPMHPGDVLVFDSWVVHGSMPNNSERCRFSLDMRWFPAHVDSNRSFFDFGEMRTHRQD
jgi:hypothetical protein